MATIQTQREEDPTSYNNRKLNSPPYVESNDKTCVAGFNPSIIKSTDEFTHFQMLAKATRT